MKVTLYSGSVVVKEFDCIKAYHEFEGFWKFVMREGPNPLTNSFVTEKSIVTNLTSVREEKEERYCSEERPCCITLFDDGKVVRQWKNVTGHYYNMRTALAFRQGDTWFDVCGTIMVEKEG